MTATYKVNTEKNGIELYFTEKPDQKVIDLLKSNRWRWHNVKKCWYAKQSEGTLAMAQTITGSDVIPSEAPKATKAPAYYTRIADYLSPEEYRAKLKEFHAIKGEQYTAFNSSEKAIEYAMENKYNDPERLTRYIRQAIIWKTLGYDPMKFHSNGENANYFAIWHKLPTLSGLKPTGREYSAMWGYDQTQITTATHFGKAFGLDVLVTGGYGYSEVLLKRINKEGRFNDGCMHFSPNEYSSKKIAETNYRAIMCGR